MVARHFSDNESADWLEDGSEAPIPQVSEDLFHVPVSENASADEAARLRVEEIMRELEEELRPKGAHARAGRAEDAASVEQPVSTSEAEAPTAAAMSMGTDDIDEPAIGDSTEESNGASESEDGLVESTRVLDRSRLGSALREREDKDGEQDERKRERLRVNPNPQNSEHETALSVVPKEEPHRPLGFFAAIGAFVARVLHLDDR